LDGYKGFSLVAPATIVLAFICETLSGVERLEFRRDFSVERIYGLHLYIWHEQHPGREINKIWASFGYLHILELFCGDPLSGQDFEFVMAICQFVVQLSPRRYGEHDVYESHYWQLFRYVLTIFMSLTASGALSPALFRECEFDEFVNSELSTAHRLSKELACGIWVNLLEHGDDGHGIPLDTIYDQIDRDPKCAPAAIRLITAMIVHAPDRGAFVSQIVCASPTCQPLRTILAAKDRSFEAMAAVVKCLMEIFRHPSRSDLRALASGAVVEALVRAIHVPEASLAVGILADLAEFARGEGGTIWKNVSTAIREWEGEAAAWDAAEGAEDPVAAATACARLQSVFSSGAE
jgi:hypothetical protein